MSPDVDKAMEEMDTDIESEINTVLPGSDPLDNLHVTHEGGTEYNVLSARNGNVTKYWVNIGPDTDCSCGDYEYNRDDAEVCAHIAAAALADRMSPEELAVSELISVTGTISQSIRDAERAADQARDAANEIEGALVKTRDSQAGGNVETPDREGSTTDTETDAADAAKRLQDAYDELIDDMEVEYQNGKVWVKTGRETPEDWPYPGGDVDRPDWMGETQGVLLFQPEIMEYDRDDDSGPGKYFKNYLDPNDVEEYISEVLE